MPNNRLFFLRWHFQAFQGSQRVHVRSLLHGWHVFSAGDLGSTYGPPARVAVVEELLPECRQRVGGGRVPSASSIGASCTCSCSCSISLCFLLSDAAQLEVAQIQALRLRQCDILHSHVLREQVLVKPRRKRVTRGNCGSVCRFEFGARGSDSSAHRLVLEHCVLASEV